MEGALMTPRHSRRAFLTGTIAAGIGLAGCGSSSPVESLRTPTFESIVSGVTVESQEVVLRLSSSEVTEAVLIGPDGTAFDSQTVETGERTVRFPIIELDVSQGSYSHYTPGTYELVIVADDEEFSQQLPLVPELQITAVEQYRDGEAPVDLSRIAFTIENIGTGPSWVYDVGFEGSPNFTADDELSGYPGIPDLEEPTTEAELLLAPDVEQRYIDGSNPLSPRTSEYTCQSSIPSFVSRVGVADGSILSAELNPTFGGDSISFGFSDRFVCTEVELNWTVIEESLE